MDKHPVIKQAFTAQLIATVVVGVALAHPHQDIDQQVLLSVGTAEATVQVRIVPSYVDGAAVFAHIDLDSDGVISLSEAAAFGSRVVSRSALHVDGRRVEFNLPRVSVPALEWVSAGLGVIEIDATAPIALTSRSQHSVEFEISFEELGHEWFVQPFYFPDLIRSLPSQAIDRSDSGSRVQISLMP